MRIAILSSARRCQTSYDVAYSFGGKMNEMLQETGFIRFFDNHYNYTTLSEADTVFLPFCFFTDATSRINSSDRVYTSWSKAYALMNDARIVLEVENILRMSKQCLLISPHQLLQPTWKTPLRFCRVLLLDKIMAGATQDVVIPYSILKNKVIRSTLRTNLIYGAGKNKWYGMFGGMRKRIFESLAHLKRKDVNVSTSRSYEAYRNGFAQSRFCIIIPGDTMSTSMLSRSILSGCVPIIVANEFRDLPFARILNYSSFSILLHIHATKHYSWARHLIRNIESIDYRLYYQNVINVQDYFDYEKFTNISPYHAALHAITYDIENSLSFE
tara:strand:+ start:6981 stop:7964 length:984 start_codon:yes stop_codon:yes gene_type:complete